MNKKQIDHISKLFGGVQITITGFVPGYVLESGIGQKIAQLKELDKGWHYPTFLLYYIRNPGPLCLFDEIIIDAEAASKAIAFLRGGHGHSYESAFTRKTKPTEKEINSLEALVESRIFKKENIIDLVTESDFKRIEKGYKRDIGIDTAGPTASNRDFQKALSYMVNKYGKNYALPSPTLFEAMNLNVAKVLSEKLGAYPLDDVYRVPLYELKSIETANLTSEDVKKSYDLINLSRRVLYLPSTSIGDVDEFLLLHKDPRVKAFRDKIHALSRMNASQQQISRELYEAELELQKLDPEYLTLAVAFLGLVGGFAEIIHGSFMSGTIGLTSGIIAIGKEWQKAFKTQRYDWLELVKGLSEP